MAIRGLSKKFFYYQLSESLSNQIKMSHAYSQYARYHGNMDGRYYVSMEDDSATVYGPDNEVWLQTLRPDKQTVVDYQNQMTHLVDVFNGESQFSPPPCLDGSQLTLDLLP